MSEPHKQRAARTSGENAGVQGGASALKAAGLRERDRLAQSIPTLFMVDL